VFRLETKQWLLLRYAELRGSTSEEDPTVGSTNEDPRVALMNEDLRRTGSRRDDGLTNEGKNRYHQEDDLKTDDNETKTQSRPGYLFNTTSARRFPSRKNLYQTQRLAD
tara:strand:+ start:82 stop:408 length:327 start_codon:yes stop_codon:yes gene_type:complete